MEGAGKIVTQTTINIRTVADLGREETFAQKYEHNIASQSWQNPCENLDFWLKFGFLVKNFVTKFFLYLAVISIIGG